MPKTGAVTWRSPAWTAALPLRDSAVWGEAASRVRARAARGAGRRRAVDVGKWLPRRSRWKPPDRVGDG